MPQKTDAQANQLSHVHAYDERTLAMSTDPSATPTLRKLEDDLRDLMTSETKVSGRPGGRETQPSASLTPSGLV